MMTKIDAARDFRLRSRLWCRSSGSSRTIDALMVAYADKMLEAAFQDIWRGAIDDLGDDRVRGHSVNDYCGDRLRRKMVELGIDL